MTLSVFKLFGTSKTLEKDGVWQNYGDVKFLLARAGGGNHAYADLLKAKIRPVRHQVDRDMLPREVDDQITAEVYAATVIKDVQVRVTTTDTSGTLDHWVKGIPSESGEVLPFSQENLVTFLLGLPDLFRDLRVCASDSAKYLKEQEQADVKNS